MRRTSVYWIAALVLLLSAALFAQAPAGAPAAAGAPQRAPASPANVPFHNTRNDMRHQTFVDIAKKGDIDILFVGDSITDWFYWPRGAEATGGKVWAANFAPLKAADFAIAGDTTQGALWRMQNGELDGFKAKLIILMLGTNNTASNPVPEIIDGDRLIVEEFKKHQPQAKILVLAVFPRFNTRMPDQTPALNAPIKEINVGLAKLADNKQVFYMDIGDKFLVNGVVPVDIMIDGLHPTEKGYQIWADAVLPTVKNLMK